MCLNYLMRKSYKYAFINFGIGNGKTLLATSLAIATAIDLQKTVFILGKNEHLIFRDQKRFEPMIRKMGLNTNLNDYSTSLGIYYITEAYFVSHLKCAQFKAFLRK